MLRRHLELVDEDSFHPLLCSHCSKPMDRLGDHASLCKVGCGVTHCYLLSQHRPECICQTYAQTSRPRLHTGGTIPDPEFRAKSSRRAGSTYHASDLGAPISRLISYNKTIRISYCRSTIAHAARTLAGAAEASDAEKLRALQYTLATLSCSMQQAPSPRSTFNSHPSTSTDSAPRRPKVSQPSRTTLR